MNPLDLFIIYLACGAPFGVYYFLQNRTRLNPTLLWLKTLLNFLFWIPFVFLFLRRYVAFKSFSIFGFGKTAAANSIKSENLLSIQKQIEQILLESKLPISIYEFRETIERYIGLTLAKRNNDGTIHEQEKEIFRVAQMKNVELGAICLKRRNRKRLSFHQTEARKDFLYFVNQLNEFDSRKEKLQMAIVELVKILKDSDAQKELERMFVNSLQTGSRLTVQNSEKDIWKPEIHIPMPAGQIASPIQTMKAANLHRKD